MQKTRLFDDACTVCNENFSVGEEVISTPCEHTFHEACIDSHINSHLDSMLQMHKRLGGTKPIDSLESESGPNCPSCNLSLIKLARNKSSFEIHDPAAAGKTVHMNDVILNIK